ncbi:type II toxin-antitoxin system YafQ family toxin [Methanococcus maripaludis]|uniref:Addiction module RelE/StbE family toxin n=1 Tax=Methanococcus maripaludis (strain DSM 14266 / JCM 13030 / NBRC 101832 / S2 / LL) TaxID=267377 RepID=Q6LZZ7_METMP|nr:type II toxin-antitoxin system mRNA interferase toxin, RelE/StbE family [Methanococcus maripaludis]CAF30032.1 conserved hypothetical protein [Methanococcus maripaludis S2]
MSDMKLAIRDKRVQKKLQKIFKKDKVHGDAIDSALDKILEYPNRGIPMTGELAGFRHLHVYDSFVILYFVDEVNNVIYIDNYGHHDEMYSWNDKMKKSKK